MPLLLFKVLDVLEKSKDCSGNQPRIILIRYQIFKESILLLSLTFKMSSNCTLPVTPKHCIGFT